LWIALTVYYRNHPQWFFIGRISDQVLVHADKPQRSTGEVGAAMSCVRKCHDVLKSLLDLGADSIGGIRPEADRPLRAAMSFSFCSVSGAELSSIALTFYSA